MGYKWRWNLTDVRMAKFGSILRALVKNCFWGGFAEQLPYELEKKPGAPLNKSTNQWEQGEVDQAKSAGLGEEIQKHSNLYQFMVIGSSFSRPFRLFHHVPSQLGSFLNHFCFGQFGGGVAYHFPCRTVPMRLEELVGSPLTTMWSEVSHPARSGMTSSISRLIFANAWVYHGLSIYII